MTWFRLEGITINDGPFLKRVKVNGKGLCIVNFDGAIYALSATCPHAGADLSGGWCKNGKIICPFHRYSYDVQTGRGDPGQNDFVETYPVEVREDGVYVGIQSFAEKIKKLFS